MVPEDFVFLQAANARTMWNLWHFGNWLLEVRPYKCLCDSQHYSRAKRIMLMLEKEVKDQNLLGA
jgi:hypothetical protein